MMRMNQPCKGEETGNAEVLLRYQKLGMLETWKLGQCGWNVGDKGGVLGNNFGEIDKD